MYPELTLPLVVLLVAATATLAWAALREPFLRRLAARQVRRRPTEAVLVVLGAMLGTAIIVGSLVVGDTLNFSVRQSAYQTLGPIDERTVSVDPQQGAQVAARLANLVRDPDVDGVLSAQMDRAAAVANGPDRRAEPRVLVWEIDPVAGGRFDPALAGVHPGAGEVVLNSELARTLAVGTGQRITIYLYGRPTGLRVAGVVPTSGVAGTGFGATTNRNAFVAPGTLLAGWDGNRSMPAPTSVTFVSNRGGVEGGVGLTDRVTTAIRSQLGPLTASGTAIDTPKRDVLDAAKQTGDALGALFLFIGSFSILAGVLLLVNIFTMLAEDRKTQLGMMRAVGMKRSRLVGQFTLEGAMYAVVSGLLGVALGIGIGRGVAYLAARIFSGWSVDGSNGLTISFSVTATSLVNGFALGLLIALLTVALTSMRISRFNIIAAIRDLPAGTTGRRRRRTFVATAAAGVVGLLAVPAVAASNGVGTYVLPPLTLALLMPALQRRLPRRRVHTTVAGLSLAWGLTANLIRPHLYDSSSTATYVALGTLLALSAVVLVVENQQLLLWPLRRLAASSTERGLAVRLAIAYPLAKRFRTGATLAMYALVVLVLILLTEINGVLSNSVDSVVRQSSAGYALRVDYNPSGPVRDPQRTFTGRDYRQTIIRVAPLASASARSTDPGHRTGDQLAVTALAGPPNAFVSMPFSERLPRLTDAAAWHLLDSDSRYVAVDSFFASTGGPPAHYFGAGDTLRLTDPRTGRTEQKIIVGLLKHGNAFYSGGSAAGAFPVLMGERTLRQLFGTGTTVSSALLATAPGVRDQTVVNQLQVNFLSAGLIATSLEASVQRMFDANTSFFRLMEGFLALGLAVGITGLGVVMVRAVRERRRTIGVLRALGFRARTIERSFLIESSIVALEGIVIGAVLGVLTTWLLYQNSSAFATLEGSFPILWGTIALAVFGTWAASLLATLGPARRAARILPALAVRVSD
jgi:putative ABC transport system permease protein